MTRFGDLIDCKPTWRINIVIYSFKSKERWAYIVGFLKNSFIDLLRKSYYEQSFLGKTKI